jgi:hypothetical protein
VPDLLLAEQGYVVAAVGEMLAMGPSLSSIATTESLAAAIQYYLSEMCNGNWSAMARLLHVHRKSLQEIYQRKQIPQLDLLLKLSQLLGATPVELLTEDISHLHFPEPNSVDLNGSKSRHSRSPRKFARESIKLKLQAILASDAVPPTSMVEVALELDYDLSFLERHLPDECGRITTRYSEYQALQKTLRTERDCELTCQITREIHQNGNYPSRRRMYQFLGGLFRNEEARQAYYDTMSELGYRHRPPRR